MRSLIKPCFRESKKLPSSENVNEFVAIDDETIISEYESALQII